MLRLLKGFDSSSTTSNRFTSNNHIVSNNNIRRNGVQSSINSNILTSNNNNNNNEYATNINDIDVTGKFITRFLCEEEKQNKENFFLPFFIIFEFHGFGTFSTLTLRGRGNIFPFLCKTKFLNKLDFFKT